MSLLNDIPLWDYDTPEELLGIDEEKHPDGHPDFWQHGWGILDTLVLAQNISNEVFFRLNKCIVLVLHSTDNPPKEENDIQIGFFLDNEDVPYLTEEIEAHTSLNKFLDLRIKEIVKECEKGGIEDLILCVCNPHSAIIERPKDIPENIRVYFPKGVVDHWKVENIFELRARRWTKL